MKPAVIILSKTRSNAIPCLRAVGAHDPGCMRIVVDDGVEFPPEGSGFDGLYEASIAGVKPFVYARNANLGIRAAGERDVILLNDDALLQTPEGFTMLQREAQEHPEYGLIASVCNNVGNPNQRPQGTYRMREDVMACFVCVLIPRRTLEMVGLLDERFIHYGWEDNDYCRRVRLAGLKIGIHDGCYVDHGSLVSTFRGHPGMGGDIGPNQRIYQEKWACA